MFFHPVFFGDIPFIFREIFLTTYTNGGIIYAGNFAHI